MMVDVSSRGFLWFGSTIPTRSIRRQINGRISDQAAICTPFGLFHQRFGQPSDMFAKFVHSPFTSPPWPPIADTAAKTHSAHPPHPAVVLRQGGAGEGRLDSAESPRCRQSAGSPGKWPKKQVSPTDRTAFQIAVGAFSDGSFACSLSILHPPREPTSMPPRSPDLRRSHDRCPPGRGGCRLAPARQHRRLCDDALASLIRCGLLTYKGKAPIPVTIRHIQRLVANSDVSISE